MATTAVTQALIAKKDRDQLKAAVQSVGKASAWEAELRRTLDFIELVRGNNPGRGEAVSQRPDVLYMLDQARQSMLQAGEAEARSAWSIGGKLGLDHSWAETKPLGIVAPDVSVPDMPTYYLEDAQKIADDARAGMLEAILDEEGWKKRLEKVAAASRMRGRMLSEAAAKDGHTWAKQHALIGTGTEGMWIADLSGNPCSHCTALNGMRRPWGETYPTHFPGLRVLGTHGPLLGPQRHPNCHCILGVVKAA